ncbi:MAG: response regulator transcription factor [Bacteroidales bacterium]|nr:response regulator transcription factor [Bacteroidales bacterium]
MDVIKILIVDDHQIFRTGLKLILNGIEHYKVVGEASGAKQMMEIIKR